MATHKGQLGRAHLARCHRHRGAREAGEGQGAQALPQEEQAAEGRARLGDCAPAGAPGIDDAIGDARRPAQALRGGRQAQCQGPQGVLGRLQAASRQRRRRHRDHGAAQLRVAQRQPGRQPARHHDGAPRRQLLRPDGRLLRRARDRRRLPRARPRADHSRAAAPRQEEEGGDGRRDQGAPRHRLRGARGRALPPAHHGRARQCAPEGRVRRPLRARARPTPR